MQNLRGINSKLISLFKQSPLYQLVQENRDTILACIRNNAIGLYYNSDKVAMVSLNHNGKLKCTINTYYLSDHYLHSKDKRNEGKEIYKTPKEIFDSFEIIKKNSDCRSTPEKKAQQDIVATNNSNRNSDWLCIDIEYRQSIKIQTAIPEKDQFTGRFDIIAISKKKPYRIAIVELKYNDKAIGGDSGIVKHLKDFNKFDNNVCVNNLKEEIQMMLSNLNDLGILNQDISVSNTVTDFAKKVEFYVICLYDTDESPRGKIGGYLFKEKHPEWGIKRVSRKNAEVELPEGCDILNKVEFLFKRVKSPTKIDITDILNIQNYEK
ncbi:MAG: hypothetical protein K2K88_03450 [Muribaculaceae bacterium]|nr:hypothetical protein [Muribaculaceae bacterium]